MHFPKPKMRALKKVKIDNCTHQRAPLVAVKITRPWLLVVGPTFFHVTLHDIGEGDGGISASHVVFFKKVPVVPDAVRVDKEGL